METDLSPIDDSYDPEPPMMQPQRQYYHEQPEPQYYQAPQQPVFVQPQQPQKKSFLSDLDSTTWIIIGLLVLIAFFMGKTMQPVIIRGP